MMCVHVPLFSQAPEGSRCPCHPVGAEDPDKPQACLEFLGDGVGCVQIGQVSPRRRVGCGFALPALAINPSGELLALVGEDLGPLGKRARIRWLSHASHCCTYLANLRAITTTKSAIKEAPNKASLAAHTRNSSGGLKSP